MILKVKQNENPYDVIGNYIEKHISVIDNIIAVISINGKICNELFLVEISSTSNFVWQTDWWEGEENVELIDFFFVSDACKEDDNNDLISRQAAIDTVVFECGEWTGLASEISKQLRQLPSAQPEPPEECERCMMEHTDEMEKLEAELAIAKSKHPEPCEDAVPRASVEYICRKNTVSTNPYEHEHHEKFIKFMDDPEIADFGRWQHSNGFNTALVAVKCDLDKVPSVTPKQRTGKWIKKHRHYGGFRSYTGFDAMGEQHTITVDERTEYDDFYCSECGTRSADISLNFCAKCGADMRGELNETY